MPAKGSIIRPHLQRSPMPEIGGALTESGTDATGSRWGTVKPGRPAFPISPRRREAKGLAEGTGVGVGILVINEDIFVLGTSERLRLGLGHEDSLAPFLAASEVLA